MEYKRVNWKDFPDTSTKMSAENFNKMDAAIAEAAEEINENTENINELSSKLDNQVYTDATKTLKTMIDEYVCPNTPLNRTRCFVIQSSNGWFKVSCNNHNDNRFTGICIILSTDQNPPMYVFVSFGGSTATLTRLNPIQSSGYLEATKDLTLKTTTWTEGASVTLPTNYAKYNVQISVVHTNSNPMVERDAVGINGIALNSFEVLRAGDIAKIGATLVGQYAGGTKLYASHYLDQSDASRAISSSIYVTYQAIV